MPKTQNHSERYSFSYRERPRRHRGSPGGCSQSPLAASVRDTRVWKTVLDRMDIQCDILQQLRRKTSCRFEATTTDDIMAGVTAVLDQASLELADRAVHLKPVSPDLVRYKVADGAPDELLFTLEEEGMMTAEDSPHSSNSSTQSDSSTLTSDVTLVASDDSEEEAGGELEYHGDRNTFSPAMDCERLPDDASARSDGSDGREDEDQEGTSGGTWREAICFRQYHRSTHPKMSWRRAHESVRKRKLLGTGRRQGRGSRAWSPRLNVSWTSIEEEIVKQGLLSSPTKLKTLVSPVRVPLTVLMTNGVCVAKNLGKKLSTANEQKKEPLVVPETQDGKTRKGQKTEHDRPSEGQRKVKDDSAKQDKSRLQEKRNDEWAVRAVTGRRPPASSQIKDLPGIPAAWRVAVTRNTNHGNNTEKHTRKTGRDGDTTVRESDREETDSNLACAMEQYVTAEPFVPGKPKATSRSRRHAADAAAAKNGAKRSETKLASKTRDVSSKSKGGEQKVIDCKSEQENAKEHQRILASLLQLTTKTAQTFQREQLPIPVIEQGVVHHRHPSPPTTITTQQTKEVGAHPNTTNEDINHVNGQEAPKENTSGTANQIGEQTAAGNDLESSGHPLLAPDRAGPQKGVDDGGNRYALPVASITHQQQQQAQGLPLDQDPALPVRQTGGTTGRGRGGPPGLPGRPLWTPSPGVAMAVSAFCQQHPRPGVPPQIPGQMPYHQIQLANWAGSRQYPNTHQHQYSSQGIQNHAQQPNGRHPQQQFANGRPQDQVPMMQPQPFANGRQQDQVPIMQLQQPFVNGRQQDQVPMMQPQQPFANERRQDQVPMMQPQQPFANGRQQDQVPMMQPQQPFANGRQQDQVPTLQPQQPLLTQPMMQQRPSIMLEDPCILYAQPNFPQTGQNNNNFRSGYHPRPPAESTNHPHVNQLREHQLGHGHQYQLNLSQPFPQGLYQPNNKNKNKNNNNHNPSNQNNHNHNNPNNNNYKDNNSAAAQPYQ